MYSFGFKGRMINPTNCIGHLIKVLLLGCNCEWEIFKRKLTLSTAMSYITAIWEVVNSIYILFIVNCFIRSISQTKTQSDKLSRSLKLLRTDYAFLILCCVCCCYLDPWIDSSIKLYAECSYPWKKRFATRQDHRFVINLFLIYYASSINLFRVRF